MRLAAAAALCLALASCRSGPQPGVTDLVEEFVFTTLAFSPSAATAQGYHNHRGRKLDTELDDLSPRAIDAQKKFYSEFHQKLSRLDRDHLTAEDRADVDILENEIALSLFDIDVTRFWRRNPALHVEVIGNALFHLWVLESAPKAERVKSIIARLEKVPAFCDTAREVRFIPAVWSKVAREENQGNMELIDRVIRDGVPAELRPAYDKAAGPALDALRRYNDYLSGGAAGGGEGWRLGAERYKTRFRFALGTSLTPDQVLTRATQDLETVRGRMLELARSLAPKYLPGPAPVNADALVRAVLDAIAVRHSTPAAYLADARQDLAEARQFVAQKHLLTLPANSNLQVIETPTFMRGVYAVGGFAAAPPLEPKLGAFYWVTPLDAGWPAARTESKLREYNFFALKLLTIHEAMPGHYVQAEIANAVEPRSRRLLRGVYGNDPYVEGWAQYATQVMLDEGFLDRSPELRLNFQKQELRVLANAILDIRMHSAGMSEAEALELMEKKTYQEHEEAVAKIQRAQLTSCQLPSYFVGWRDWVRLREAVRRQKGAAFDPAQFHDAALREGAVPLPVLARLLTGKSLD